MWNYFERARRFRLPAIRYSRLGATGAFGIAALVVIFVAAALLDLRGDRAEVVRFGATAREQQVKPIEAIVEAARSHRFVFIADVAGSGDAKRLVGDAIAGIAQSSGLDAVIVEVGSDQQPYLDLYFNTDPEDASVLLGHPQTLHEGSSEDRDFLELYHRIWQLNKKLGADRHIRVVAGDLKEWGAPNALSPAELARRYGERSRAMAEALDRSVLTMSARARVVIFMSGLHALRSGYVQLQTGGTATVEAPWFAARLAESHPGEVYSVLVEASPTGVARDFVDYQGTRLPEVAESALPNGKYALRIDESFDFLSNPIARRSTPGITFQIAPRGYRLSDVADLYVHLGH